MSREHKYRGMTKEGKWVYGYHFADDELKRHFIIPDFECTGGLIRTDGRYGDFINAFIEVDPSTIGEFTGLKDKNGKEIYEGDKVRWDDRSKGQYWRIAKVIIECGCGGFEILPSSPTCEAGETFWFGQFCYWPDPEADGNVLEVIGNIHQPEGE